MWWDYLTKERNIFVCEWNNNQFVTFWRNELEIMQYAYFYWINNTLRINWNYENAGEYFMVIDRLKILKYFTFNQNVLLLKSNNAKKKKRVNGEFKRVKINSFLVKFNIHKFHAYLSLNKISQHHQHIQAWVLHNSTLLLILS